MVAESEKMWQCCFENQKQVYVFHWNSSLTFFPLALALCLLRLLCHSLLSPAFLAAAAVSWTVWLKYSCWRIQQLLSVDSAFQAVKGSESFFDLLMTIIFFPDTYWKVLFVMFFFYKCWIYEFCNKQTLFIHTKIDSQHKNVPVPLDCKTLVLHDKGVWHCF